MVKGSDIKVVLACVFQDPSPLWMMLTTCKQFGIDPLLFGQGETYQGWVHIKIKLLKTVAEAVKRQGYSHVLYTDARDAWFCAGLDEVARAYNTYGAPPLMLGSQYRQFPGFEPWYKEYPEVAGGFRYPATPGIIAETGHLIDCLQHMQDNYHGFPDDDPPWWCTLDKDKGFKLDHYNRIFMNVGDMDDGMWEIVGGQVNNKYTDTHPAIIHFNGGYSHALMGKWDRLEPHWKACGHEERPPWEEK